MTHEILNFFRMKSSAGSKEIWKNEHNPFLPNGPFHTEVG